jgi:UDP-GlcNAc:undecaprenyl-phosphate GlcNAc-1-phosphate transferase
MLQFMTPLSIGFLVTLAMMLALRPIAAHLGLVDLPGGRKTHVGEVPVIGGIAMFLGMLAAALSLEVPWAGEAPMLVASALMVIVGSLDDRFDVVPYARIVAHIAAAVTLTMASGYTVESLGDLFGFGDVVLGPVAFAFTVVAAIALINGFNMLDGLDGLAGGVALIALVGLSYYFIASGSGSVAIVSLGLVGAICAFLIFNLPAKFNRSVLAFMGDAGSTLLGFMLAGLALVAIQPRGQGLPPVVVLWLLPIPIIELFTSTIRRAVTGLSPMQADRGHFHHRLLEGGFSVKAIFILYLFVSSVSAVAGLWLWRAGASEPFLFYLFLVMAAIWLLGTHHVTRLVGYLPEPLQRGRLPRHLLPRRVRTKRHNG